MTVLTRDDCSQLYSGCLVEIEGKLGFVRDIVDHEDRAKLAVRFMGDRANVLIVPDPDIVLCPSSPYRLGYVQYTDEAASYLSRSPRRQYRVGWCEENVGRLNIPSLMRMGTRLADNLLGKFPTYEEALAQASRNGGEVAFDRMFSVSRGGTVLSYKGNGLCHIRDGVPVLEGGQKSIDGLLKKAMGV